MSGWTRALTQQPAGGKDAASATPASLWVSDSECIGQAASSALATRFEVLVQALLADADDLQAQQAIIDLLRAGIDAEEGATAEIQAANDAGLSPLDRARLTLASFSLALQRLNSFSLLEAQYAQLLDQLSFDLCDVLLPALFAEWERVARTTHASLISSAESSLGASSAEAEVSQASRPLASGLLTLLLHLLGEIVAHANPREVALTLLAFYERHVHDDEQEEIEEGEEDEFDAEEQKHAASAKTASAQSTTPAKLSPFHRLSLAFPLLELLATLVRRSAAAAPANAQSSSAAGSLSARHLEMYRQLLNMLQRTLRRVSNQIEERDEERSMGYEADSPELKRLESERNLFIGLHIKLSNECLDSMQPLFTPIEQATASAAATAVSTSASATPAKSASPTPAAGTSHSQLRSSVLAFLFQQLAGFFVVYREQAPHLQAILDGNRAAAAAAAAESASSAAVGSIATPPSSSLTPGVALLLSLLFRLCAGVDRCSVTPMELLEYSRVQRRLERRIAREEERDWAAHGDDDEFGEDDEDDEASDDGNRKDDEYDSDDAFEENAAVDAFDRAQARQRKPPSALKVLRATLASLPAYNVQGVGHYLATACGFQYFFRVKPARLAAIKATSAVDPAAADPQLATLLSSLPDVGASFVANAQQVPPRALLDSVSPFLACLLLQGLQGGGGGLASIAQGISLATALWALLPPQSISIPEQPSAKPAGQSDEDEEDRLSEESLEGSGAWLLSECLLQCMYLCPSSWPSLRTSLLQLWKDLLSCLGVNTRVRLLQLSVSACAIVSVQAVVLHRIKEEVVAAWNDTSDATGSAPSSSSVERATFLTPDLLAMLHSYVSQTQVNLLESLDMLLACINLFRFCVLREKADARAQRASRLELLRAPVRRVWADKWREVAQQADQQAAELEQQLVEAAADERQQIATLRNQTLLASELGNLVLQQLEEP